MIGIRSCCPLLATFRRVRRGQRKAEAGRRARGLKARGSRKAATGSALAAGGRLAAWAGRRAGALPGRFALRGGCAAAAGGGMLGDDAEEDDHVADLESSLRDRPRLVQRQIDERLDPLQHLLDLARPVAIRL